METSRREFLKGVTQIDGTVVSECVSPSPRPLPRGGEEKGEGADLRLGHPSGVLPVAALVESAATGGPVARQVTVYRTARRLMEGFDRIPEPSRLA